VPPARIAEAATGARGLGAKIIVVHGETLVEPVAPGTNRAALEADIDILAHPGLISEEEARLAARRCICLEITTRKGHSLSNGHVAQMARRCGAKLIVNTDSHAPGDLTPREMARKIAMGAGLSGEEFEQCLKNSEALVEKALGQARSFVMK
jgi:histidinol phosphatase-like PHP family hydrolase